MRRPVAVWDLPTRLFHWALVALVAVQAISGQIGGNALDLHLPCGYAMLALLLFRLAWGLAGSPTARFSDFVRSPVAAIAYLRALRAGRAPATAGHNPAGGLMVVALLAVLLIQVATGLCANDDILTEGPLAHRVGTAASGLLTTLHKLGFKLLLVLVAAHLGGVLTHALFERENLVSAMLTGRKTLPPELEARCQPFAGAIRAALLLALAAGAVAALVGWA